MATQSVKEQLAHDVSSWQADGLISEASAGVLRERYDVPSFGFISLIKYLGIIGGIFAIFGFLGFIATLSGSISFGAFITVSLALLLFYAGIRMSLDPKGRYPYSSKWVLTIAACQLAGAIVLLANLAKLPDKQIILVNGLVVLPLLFILSYRFKNNFLLILGLLYFFHWIGSWNTMIGRSTYEFGIQNPNIMAMVALLVIAVGIYHQRFWKQQTLQFYKAYQAIGLLYLNMSLLILSIYPHAGALPYIVLLALATLAQMVAGARLHSGLFMGFGVTFFAINLYTRFYENFWDSLGKGLFFLIGGLVLFGFGMIFEKLTSPSAKEGLV